MLISVLRAYEFVTSGGRRRGFFWLRVCCAYEGERSSRAAIESWERQQTYGWKLERENRPFQ